MPQFIEKRRTVMAVQWTGDITTFDPTIIGTTKAQFAKYLDRIVNGIAEMRMPGLGNVITVEVGDYFIRDVDDKVKYVSQSDIGKYWEVVA